MPQDDLENVRENYRRLRAGIGCEERERCWVYQVHGAEICSVAAGVGFESGVKADALVTDDAERLVSVKYADCVPILMATSNGRVVGAVHAGWRGVVAGVVGRAVLKLLETAKLESAETVLAAVGPCIGFERFEVGSEVLEAMRSEFGEAAPVRPVGEKGFVDLKEAVRLQLVRAGLRADHIDISEGCTVRDQDDFFSHRRDGGVTGRMAAIIGPVRS